MKVLQHRLFPSLCNRIAWKSENRGRYGGERPSMTDPQDFSLPVRGAEMSAACGGKSESKAW